MFDGNFGYDVHDSTAALTCRGTHEQDSRGEKRREGEDGEDANKDVMGLRRQKYMQVMPWLYSHEYAAQNICLIYMFGFRT